MPSKTNTTIHYENQMAQPSNFAQIEIVKVKSSNVLDKIASQLDVYTRADVCDEIIIDCTDFGKEDNREVELRAITGLEDKEIYGLNGFVLFHC
jgi:hypothetical protein